MITPVGRQTGDYSFRRHEGVCRY